MGDQPDWRQAFSQPPFISQGWLDEEFARDGIKVASLRASGERSVRESHFDHTQPDSFRQGGNIPPIWTRSTRLGAVVFFFMLPCYQRNTLTQRSFLL